MGIDLARVVKVRCWTELLRHPLLEFKASTVRRNLRRTHVGPIFIVAAPRSGCTALCRGLNQHSQLLIASGENPMAHWLAMCAHAYQYSRNPEHYRRYTALGAEDLRTALCRLFIDCIWGRSDRLVKAYRKNYCDRSPVPPWQVSMWGARAAPDEESAKGLEWLFPGVKFLYIFRNGIDAVFSMSRFRSFCGLPFADNCRRWARSAVRYEFLQHRENSLAIRFEDFLENPEVTFARILGHLKVSLERGPSHLARDLTVHPLDRPTVKMSAKATILARPPAHLGWSAEEKEVFRVNCTAAMKLLKYTIPF
jgi:hypothetical protein